MEISKEELQKVAQLIVNTERWIKKHGDGSFRAFCEITGALGVLRALGIHYDYEQDSDGNCTAFFIGGEMYEI